MSNTDEKKLGKSEYFELREKRLKLVYKILYVVVAIWIGLVVSIGNQGTTQGSAPLFAFLLAGSSLITINIIRYCVMEFRCMRVIGRIDEVLMEKTEEKYDKIWKSFSTILSGNALLMFLTFVFFRYITEMALLLTFGGCTVYFVIVSNIRLYTSATSKNEKISGILDGLGLYIGIIMAYSISAFSCMVMAR